MFLNLIPQLLTTGATEIMADLSPRARNSVALQQEMFRLADRDYGLSVAVLARSSGISPSTIKGWRDGAAMPLWAIGELSIPDDIASLVLAPFAKHIGTDEDGEGDLDTAALDAGEAQQAVQRARHPNSPGGVSIVPQEVAAIVPLLRKSVASGRRAVAA